MEKAILVGFLLGAGVLGCEPRDPSLAPKTGDLPAGLNTVMKDYPYPSLEVVAAARRAMDGLDLRVDEDGLVKLGSEFFALRAARDGVIVEIQGGNPCHARVAVQMDPVDRSTANLIHARIQDELDRAGRRKP